MDGLTGLTINLEDHIPRSEFMVEDCVSGTAGGSEESLDDTIDRIIQQTNGDKTSLLDVSRLTTVPTKMATTIPTMITIPDSLPPADHQAYQTPVASSSLSMSSVLRMSMRVRSSAEHHQQAGIFKRPTVTPLTAQGSRMRMIEAQSPCPNPNVSGISSSLFDESSSQSEKDGPEKDKPSVYTMPPLALFDLSGSLPPTAQLFPPSQSSAGTRMEDYSFRTRTTGRTTGSSRDSLLVPATQYVPGTDGGEVVDTGKLLPTTPTIPTTSSNEEIPPTQFPVSKVNCSPLLVANTQQPTTSQVDLFAANLVNTQGNEESIPGTLSLTDPSLAPTFSPAIIVTPDLPIEVILEEPEYDSRTIPYSEPYSGHEMVMLPDSLDEQEDDEDNPFTVKEDPVQYSDVGRISEPPVLPSQAPPTQEELDREDEGNEPNVPTQQDPTQEPVRVLEVPRTGKKVKFAPTPVDSSQPPPPTTVSLYRTRTDTQEMEETFATSLLSKFCQQIVTVPRSEMTPVKDVEERLMADGDIEMKPKTPLKIVSRGATPIKPFASASKTLTRIIEAITPGKKMASSCAASKISSPCPQRVVKATPMAKRTLPTPKELKSTKKQKTSPAKKQDFDKRNPSTLVPAISGSTVLGEGLLVWAHWRLQYFTAGTVEKKKSTRREVWQVRPFHRTSTTLDLSADHMLPLVLLEPGNTVLHITDRRSYKMQKRQFSRFVPGDEAEEEGVVLIEVEGGERLELKDVIIDRTVFTAKHKDWRASISAPPSSDPAVEEIDEDVENEEPNTLNSVQEPRYSLTGVGLFTGLSFLLTGCNDKSRVTSTIQEGGGTVIEDLTPSSLPDPSNLILISTDTEPCRTAKYYCAVLLGVERLKAGWIEASLKKGKLAPFPPYRLPPTSSGKTTVHLFSDTHLSFVGSKSYKSSCAQIAVFTSATLVDPRRLASLKDRTVVVVLEAADALTPRLQATCLANGHLIAEKAWFTDSILQGRVLPLS